MTPTYENYKIEYLNLIELITKLNIEQMKAIEKIIKTNFIQLEDK